MKRSPNNFLVFGLALLAMWTLTACQKEVVEKTSSAAKVLVHVNGSPITNAELDYTLIRIFGPEKAFQTDRKTRDDVLKSLVMSRAISQAANKAQSQEAQAQLNLEVAEYREQLMVKGYLKKNAAPKPISEESIKTFYDKNQARFGAKTIRNFEVISTRQRLQGAERAQIMKILAKAEGVSNWKKYAQQQKQRAPVIEYRQGNSNEKLLHASLSTVIKTLAVKQSSKPFFVEGKAYVVRVMKEKKQTARPLIEVRNEIRRALLPLQLRTAISDISDEVMKTAKVEYVE